MIQGYIMPLGALGVRSAITDDYECLAYQHKIRGHGSMSSGDPFSTLVCYEKFERNEASQPQVVLLNIIL